MLTRKGIRCLMRFVLLDHYQSPLAQVSAMTVLESQTAESQAQKELATLLLAVNYELLGYAPAHAWLLAQRGEEGAVPRRLDG